MNSSEDDPGRVLVNRYRLDHVIGTGGMGRVWRGTDTLLDRPVAVKELTTPPNLPAHEVEVLRTRMLREARSAAQLSHPSIITVFDVAEEDGRPWIVMELVQGPSLGDLLREEGTLCVRRAADIGEQMAAGLSEAHNHGIVHRDIKPGNVLTAGNDRAVLTDFGIAHLDGSTHLTSTGLLIGSPSYLAPEVAHGHSATPASDVWALGITLFQAVEGTLPFERPTPMATLTAIVTQDLPETVNAGPLRPLLEDLCAKDPQARPSIGEARARLREIRESTNGATAASMPHSATTLVAEPPPVPTPEPQQPADTETPEPTGSVRAASVPPTAPRHTRTSAVGRRRNLVVVAAVLLLLVVGATTGVLWNMNRSGGDSEAGLVGDAEQDGQEQQEDTDHEDDTTEEVTVDPSEEGHEDEEDEEEEWDFLDHYEDESGFALDVPEDWEIDQQGRMVYFRNPDGGYLQIDQTDTPNDDAGDDWRDFEPQAKGGFSGYSLIGIDDVDADWTDDYVSAADWEFTFEGSDGEMHAINRGFHTEDKGYALFLVSPEHQSVNHALLDRISESFEPAS